MSFDSTMRSNISVGLPIDLCAIETDALRVRMADKIIEAAQDLLAKKLTPEVQDKLVDDALGKVVLN